MSRALRVMLLTTLVLAAGAAGCLRKPTTAVVEEQDDGPALQTAVERAAELAAPKPVRYSFAGQQKLDRVEMYFNGTVSAADANAGIESPQDWGGTSYNTVVKTQDAKAFIPDGQPTLMEIQLWYNNGPARSADLDIFVDVPSMRTHEDRSYAGEYMWTLPVKTRMVSTIGTPGADHLIGVQIANGRMAPTETLEYWLRVTFFYAQNAAAPGVPYAITVPEDASGLIVESLKFQGDTHIRAHYLVIDPEDELVAAVDFNDIDIPTESMYIPVRKPGTYIFYINDIRGGFLTLRTDVPLDDPVAKPLPVTRIRIPLFSDAVAPGTGETWIHGTATPYTEGTKFAFAIDGAFPLEVRPALASGVAGDVEVRLSSSMGLVSLHHRTARMDDERGSIGFTDEQNAYNRQFFPEKLAKGTWTASAVINGYTGKIEAEVVSYTRA